MVTTNLRGAVVVLTGASSGIGRATALAFADAGARLVLAARHGEALDATARACAARQAEAVTVPLDVRDAEAVDRLAEVALSRFGRLDIWVNNAGVYLMGSLETTPPDIFRAVLETNTMGLVHGCRAALREFRRQGSGVIINVGSLAGRGAYAYASAYSASKHAVVAIHEALRQELLGTDIEACLVTTGTIDTPFFQHAANFTGREIIAMRPVHAPEIVAEAIVELARRPRREVVIGAGPQLLLSVIETLMPDFYARLRRWAVELGHFGTAAAPPDPGNVMQPRPPYRIHGGWAEREQEERDEQPTRARRESLQAHAAAE